MSGTEAAGQAEGGFDAGQLIMHHILDSHEIEIPFTSKVIHLPEIHVGGIDLSIGAIYGLAGAIFYGFSVYRKRQGIDVDKIYKEIPVE